MEPNTTKLNLLDSLLQEIFAYFSSYQLEEYTPLAVYSLQSSSILREGRSPSGIMSTMVDSWMLATLSMWFEKLDKQEAINLISDKFNFEELWVAALELNQLCADRSMSKKIPKNQDQGDLSDRVKVLALAMYGSIQELKGRVDNPTFVVSSMQLCNVPGVVTDNVKAEPVVSARLDSIEKLIENLNKDFK